MSNKAIRITLGTVIIVAAILGFMRFSRSMSEAKLDPLRWTQQAGTGDALAQAYLGHALYQGYMSNYGLKMDRPKGVDWINQSATANHPLGLCLRGLLRIGACTSGSRVKLDDASAQQDFKAAVGRGLLRDAESGGPVWWLVVGRAIELKCVTADDGRPAAAWYRKSADAGNSEGMRLLAGCYTQGTDLEKDPSQAEKWLRKSAEAGSPDGMYLLGNYYDSGTNAVENEPLAAQWYLKAAELGHASAQYRVGLCFELGIGKPQDESTGLKWLLMSAEQGLADAQSYLGKHYIGKKDDMEAAKWYRKAAEQGDPNDQFAMGNFYADGRGLPKNLDEAARWYRKSADQGCAHGQLAIGACYENGAGVETSRRDAMKWYRLAADSGDADAMYRLAMCHDSVIGVESNPDEVLKWLRKASDAGQQDARSKLESILKLDNSETAGSPKPAPIETAAVDTDPTRKSGPGEKLTGKALETRADSEKKVIAALGVFKKATLEEAKEVVRLLEAAQKIDPGNEGIPKLEDIIKEVFREEAGLKKSLSDRKEADAQYEAKMKNLGIVLTPSRLRGKVDVNEATRLKSEADEIIPKAEKVIEASRSRLASSLSSAAKEIPPPEREILSPTWNAIATRSGIQASPGTGTYAAVPVAPKIPVIKIISAIYGSGGKNADVTARVTELVEVKHQTFSANPGNLGADPNPGWNKGLTIVYTVNGVRCEQHRNENETILIESFNPPPTP